MKQSSPLKDHSWLNDALKARHAIVKIALDKVASEHLLGHKPGGWIKNASALERCLPETVDVTFPMVGTHIAPLAGKVVTTTDAKRCIAVECTAAGMTYVREAMIASKRGWVDQKAASRPCKSAEHCHWHTWCASHRTRPRQVRVPWRRWQD
jgi:hypothetical protein